MLAIVDVESAMTDYVSTQKNDESLSAVNIENIRLDDESYAIEVVLEVAELHNNFKAGNVYMQAKLNSF